MNSIRNIFYSITVIAIVSGFLEALSSSSKHKKYTKYAISLVTVLCLLSPLQNLISTVNSLDIDTSIFTQQENANNTKNVSRSLETAITYDICNKYKLPESAISVQIVLTDSNLIESIRINIIDQSYFRYAERIQAYLNSAYGCEIQVIQEFE